MLSRRELMQLTTAAAMLPWGCGRSSRPAVLNDVHSQLNPTRVARLERPRSLAELRAVVRRAAHRGETLSVSGGRHAMGGQQFGTDTVHLDIRGVDRFLAFDPDRGTVEVEAGIQWPELVSQIHEQQDRSGQQWGIRQKQTGADRLTLGGALAANIHGRGLRYPPFVDDVESLVLLDPKGERHRCSRSENPELFALAVGGYGCFGVVSSLVLRLVPRQKVERVVEVRSVVGLAEALEERIEAGFLFGDFQFKTDETASDYLQSGVLSCYRPVAQETPVPHRQRRLSRSRWQALLELAHADKARAFEVYSDYYRSTDRQVYWSDTHQLSPYLDDYHRGLDRRLGARLRGSEMISEVYVPRARLGEFMGIAAEAFRREGVNVIYGTVRLISEDEITFLAWAREPWACIVFNLHVEHSEAGIEKARRQFRRLIDLAIDQGGSYFLTYHRWATREQIEICHPRMPEFLRRKLGWDPDERFQSDWYRHYRQMFHATL